MLNILWVTFPFFALVGCGFVAARRRLLPLDAIGGLNGFVLFFALPCMLYRFGSTTPIAQLLDASVFGVYLVCALVMVAFAVAMTLSERIRWNDAAFGGGGGSSGTASGGGESGGSPTSGASSADSSGSATGGACWDGPDADSDGQPDACDPCPNDAANDGDGDGLCGDVDPCPTGVEADEDGDGVCDQADLCPGSDDTLDAAMDGAVHGCDPCPQDPDDDGDADGVCGDLDNCVVVANEGQADGRRRRAGRCVRCVQRTALCRRPGRL